MSLVRFRPEAPEKEEAARRLKKEGRRAAGKQNADLAHLVERDLAKVEVAGSNPVIRSKGAARRRPPRIGAVLPSLSGEIVFLPLSMLMWHRW